MNGALHGYLEYTENTLVIMLMNHFGDWIFQDFEDERCFGGLAGNVQPAGDLGD